MQGSLAGKLLVAMPGIGDPRFEQAVILMCLHTPDAAMGLIVNKPRAEITLGDVLGHLGIEVEGDVAQRREGISLTATREVLAALTTDHPPEKFVLALGHSDWAGGQLESELAHNAWLVAEADQAIIFGEAHGGKWGSAIRQLGFEPSQLVGDQGRA
jgi:putative transcriptional regulator